MERPVPPCEVPPQGWYCTRERGHDGPCAALPTGDAYPLDLNQVGTIVVGRVDGPQEVKFKLKPGGRVDVGITRLRIKTDGRSENTVIEAYRGDASVPLDVEAFAFEMDCHGGRVSMSCPASAVDFEVDVRPMTPDERVDAMVKMLFEAADALDRSTGAGRLADERHHASYKLADDIRMWLKLHELGRR